MKRKIFIFILTTLTTVCLFGCSSKKEDTDNTNSERTETTEIVTTTEVQTEATTEDEALKAEMERQQYLQDLYKYYGNCLKNYHTDNEYGSPHFLICDLNDNGIPELYIGEGTHEYAGEFLVKKMYADIDSEIELPFDMEMYDGFLEYCFFVDTSDETWESVVKFMQLDENNMLEEAFKYSCIAIPVTPIDSEFEYYIFDEDGNKIKCSEEKIRQQYHMLKSIYKAYDLSDSNIMALEGGTLEWNAQPPEEEYFVCGEYKMLCGLYQGTLAIVGEDGDSVKNYITFKNDGTFVLMENKEPLQDDKKVTGKYEGKNGYLYLYYDSNEYFEDLHIYPIQDNYEVFMVNSCSSMQDQWHGYGYIGNQQNLEETKITE